MNLLGKPSGVRANSGHVAVVDPLRGAAALSVCMFHFAATGKLLTLGDPVRRICSFGSLGVDAFFVISGFIIPYSLFLRSYRLRDSFGFLVRRLKRLEPPYFACIALVIFLNAVSAWIHRGSVSPGLPSAGQLLAHVAYLNAILDYGWLNPVFWTLAIEFQFYFFAALAFPLLNRQRATHCVIVLIAVSLVGLAGRSYPSLLFYWLPLFAIGMTSFQFVVRRLTLSGFLLILAVLAAISYFVLGAPPTLVGVFTGLAIGLCGCRAVPRVFSPLAAVGTISYSLYLMHVPLGMRVVSLACRLPGLRIYRYPAIVLALALTALGSYWFWKWVEQPSHRWAKETRRNSNPASNRPEHDAVAVGQVAAETGHICAEAGNA